MQFDPAALLEQLSSPDPDNFLPVYKELTKEAWEELLFNPEYTEYAERITRRTVEILGTGLDVMTLIHVFKALKYVLPTVSINEYMNIGSKLSGKTPLSLQFLARGTNRQPGLFKVLLQLCQNAFDFVGKIGSTNEERSETLLNSAGSADALDSILPRFSLVALPIQVDELQGICTILGQSPIEELSNSGYATLANLFHRFDDDQWYKFSRFILTILQPERTPVVSQSGFLISSLFSLADRTRRDELSDILSALVELADIDALPQPGSAIEAIATLLGGQEQEVLDNRTIGRLIDLAVRGLRFECNDHVFDDMDMQLRRLDVDFDLEDPDDVEDAMELLRETSRIDVRTASSALIGELIRLSNAPDKREMMVQALFDAVDEDDRETQSAALNSLEMSATLYPELLKDHLDKILAGLAHSTQGGAFLTMFEIVGRETFGLSTEQYLERVAKLVEERYELEGQSKQVLSLIDSAIKDPSFGDTSEQSRTYFWQAAEPALRLFLDKAFPLKHGTFALPVIAISGRASFLAKCNEFLGLYNDESLKNSTITTSLELARDARVSDEAVVEFLDELYTLVSGNDQQLMLLEGLQELLRERSFSSSTSPVPGALKFFESLLEESPDTVMARAILQSLAVLRTVEPELEVEIANLISAVPNEPGTLDLKAEALIRIPKYSGISHLALDLAAQVAKDEPLSSDLCGLPNLPPQTGLSPLGRLFAAIAQEQSADENNELLKLVSQKGIDAGPAAAVWAETASAIMVKGDLPLDEFTSQVQWSNWDALVSVFLAEQGVTVASTEAILKQFRGKEATSLITGYALGASSILSGSAAIKDILDPDIQGPELLLGALDVLASKLSANLYLLPPIRAALAALKPHALLSHETISVNILGRVLGHVCLESTDGLALLQEWSATSAGPHAAWVILDAGGKQSAKAASALISMTSSVNSPARTITKDALTLVVRMTRSHPKLAGELDAELVGPLLLNAKREGTSNSAIRKVAYDGLLEFTELAPRKENFFELTKAPYAILFGPSSTLRETKKSVERLKQPPEPYYKDIFKMALVGLEDGAEIATTSLELLAVLSRKEPGVVSDSLTTHNEQDIAGVINPLRDAFEKLAEAAKLPKHKISSACMLITKALLEQGYWDPALDEWVQDKRELYRLRIATRERQGCEDNWRETLVDLSFD